MLHKGEMSGTITYFTRRPILKYNTVLHFLFSGKNQWLDRNKTFWDVIIFFINQALAHFPSSFSDNKVIITNTNQRTIVSENVVR